MSLDGVSCPYTGIGETIGPGAGLVPGGMGNFPDRDLSQGNF